MRRIATVLCLLLLLTPTAMAQTAGAEADHAALRKLKADAVDAVNRRDYPLARRVLHEPFMATLITQDSFTDFEKLKAYFESLYTRPLLRMKTVTLDASADDLSQIYQGTFAINRGTTKENYELADGRKFEMTGRWTAISIKQGDAWKVMAVHTGTNFLDNPVLTAIERSIVTVALWSALGGLLLGLVSGWVLHRVRAR